MSYNVKVTLYDVAYAFNFLHIQISSIFVFYCSRFTLTRPHETMDYDAACSVCFGINIDMLKATGKPRPSYAQLQIASQSCSACKVLLSSALRWARLCDVEDIFQQQVDSVELRVENRHFLVAEFRNETKSINVLELEFYNHYG